MRVLTMQEYRLWQKNPNGLNTLADDSSIEKAFGVARGGKYLRRVATGNPKRPWMYIYKEFTKRGLLDAKLQALPVASLELGKDALTLSDEDLEEQKRSSKALAAYIYDAEASAIHAWTYMDSDSIRRVSILGKPSSTWPDDLARKVVRWTAKLTDLISKAESQADRKPVTLYRGINVRDDVLAKMLAGDVMQDAGLSSWTTVPRVAVSKSDNSPMTSVVFKVRTAKGAPIVLQSQIPDECETLMPPKAFKIVGKKALLSSAGKAMRDFIESGRSKDPNEKIRVNHVLLELEEMPDEAKAA